jgi:PAS domain S-box-containing protein
LELLFRATQDGIVDWNLISNQADYNPRWKFLLGFDDGELSEAQNTPQLWQELVHPDDRDAVLALLSEHLEQDWPFSTAVRMRHRCGGYRHILCRGTSHRDAEDRPVRMLIIFSDIDERIRDEGRQRALVAALPDTLFRIQNGTISGVKRGREREGSPFAALRDGMTLSESFSDPRVLARLEAALLVGTSNETPSANAVQVISLTGSGAALSGSRAATKTKQFVSCATSPNNESSRRVCSRVRSSEPSGGWQPVWLTRSIRPCNTSAITCTSRVVLSPICLRCSSATRRPRRPLKTRR